MNDGLSKESQPATTKMIPIEFQTDNGWTYDGRIELPPAGKRRGWAVVLIGGGMGTNIDWLAPGFMTIDGKPTHDADTIAKALLDRGFVVMRWQAIRRDDPYHAKDEWRLNRGSFEQTVEQAHKALAAFRTKHVVPDNHIFIVGHSLGAHRAAALVSENPTLAGVVMLAGARLVPSDLAAVRGCVSDANTAFDAMKKPVRSITRHGYAIEFLGKRRSEWEKRFADVSTRANTPWPAEVFAKNRTPVLSLVGSLDKRWLYEMYLLTINLRHAGHPDYAYVVFDGLGHELGQTQAGDVTHEEYGVVASSRIGPIDAAVVTKIVAWIVRRAK